MGGRRPCTGSRSPVRGRCRKSTSRTKNVVVTLDTAISGAGHNRLPAGTQENWLLPRGRVAGNVPGMSGNRGRDVAKWAASATCASASSRPATERRRASPRGGSRRCRPEERRQGPYGSTEADLRRRARAPRPSAVRPQGETAIPRVQMPRPFQGATSASPIGNDGLTRCSGRGRRCGERGRPQPCSQVERTYWDRTQVPPVLIAAFPSRERQPTDEEEAVSRSRIRAAAAW